MRRFVRFLTVTYLWILLLPYAFILTGAASNQLVLIANHDTFPVLMREPLASKALPDDEGHVAMTKDTHLNLLGDILDFHNEGWESVGDLTLETGYWLQSVCPYLFAAFAIRRLVDNNGIWTSEDE
jgi:hypothetical protein